MRRTCTFVLASLLCMAMAACSGGEDRLAAPTAKRAVKKEMKRQHLESLFTTVTTGYYECNSDQQRYELRKLAANGLVNYRCDKVRKPELKRRSRQVVRGYYFTYYDTEYYYVRDTTDVYFVSVELTPEGLKLLKPEGDDNVLDDPALDNSSVEEKWANLTFPEYSVPEEEFPDKKADSAVSSSDVPAIDIGHPADDDESAEESRYELLKEKEKQENVAVRACDLKVVKVYNIELTHGDKPSAQGKVIYRMCNVTPFGRIMEEMVEGYSRAVSVQFKYTQDKGWVASDFVAD